MQTTEQSKTLAKNYHAVKENIKKACEQAGRSHEEVTLLAVSKTKPVDMLMDVYHAGARDFGENKVQELQSIVNEREGKAEEWQHILVERQEEADKIVTEFTKKVDDLADRVTAKMTEIETSISGQVAEVKRASEEQLASNRKLNEDQIAANKKLSEEQLATNKQFLEEQAIANKKLSEGQIAEVKALLENATAQLESIKTDLSEKVHSENVKCYRNIQDLFNEFDSKIEKMDEMEQGVGSVKGYVKCLSWFAILNFVVLIGFIMYSLGVFNF